MKVIYFDCFAGICGSMVLGALLDAGLPFGEFKKELDALGLENWDISHEKVKKHSISGTLVRVTSGEKQPHRHLHHITDIINKSSLDARVKEDGIRVFTRLAEAEAKIHATTIEKIHFHEVGAIDAIVDIVGSVLGFRMMGIEAIYSSPVPTGNGFVKCAHGLMPVPAPATAELLQGVPHQPSEIRFELTTPTGAALVSTLARGFGPRPPMQTEIVSYGSGEYDLDIPNLLRAYIGELDESSVGRAAVGRAADASLARIEGMETDRVLLLQANIDDMNPEFFEAAFDALYAAGALEVYAAPVYMKKNRPATLLSVLAVPGDGDRLREILFRQTTTLGVRSREMERRKLRREIREVRTERGTVKVKLGFLGEEILQIAPEYEDCKRLAGETGVPARQVYEEAKHAARNSLS